LFITFIVDSGKVCGADFGSLFLVVPWGRILVIIIENGKLKWSGRERGGYGFAVKLGL
jgi:hypothetical protein